MNNNVSDIRKQPPGPPPPPQNPMQVCVRAAVLLRHEFPPKDLGIVPTRICVLPNTPGIVVGAREGKVIVLWEVVVIEHDEEPGVAFRVACPVPVDQLAFDSARLV